MAIQYKAVKVVKPSSMGGDSVKYQARACNRGRIGLREVSLIINNETTYSGPDVYGVVEAVFTKVAELLVRGHTVDFEELGIFSPHLKSELKDSPEEVVSSTIKETKIRFKPGAALQRILAEAKYEKARQLTN